MKNLLALLALVAAAVSGAASDHPLTPATFQGIGIDQRLNAPVPLDARFHDEAGKDVALGDYFHDKPVLLVPFYYECPMLCSQVLSGVVEALRPLSLLPGRDFEVVSFSFNPDDTPKDAAEARDRYSYLYSRKRGTAGWHFLTGSEASIHTLTEAIGYHYRWDPASKTFLHASGIMVLTPQGSVARYLYGVEYEPKDLKLSLVESSHNKIGSLTDQILLFCYHYDPSTGKYTATVMKIVRFGGGLTVLGLVVGLGLLWRSDLRQHDPSGGEARRQ